MSERIDRTERLLNLVICLMAAPVPVPRADIRRTIPGYGEASSDAAFERMFERDKDELRSMGIPVQTVADSGGEVLGYRIPQEAYVLADLDLTIAERAAVAVAAQVWGQAVLAPVAGTALRKLETLGDDAATWSPAGLQGSIELTASEGALLPLMAALRQDRVVTFPYRTPADPESRSRTVSPWGLRSTSGRWFLVGFDHDRAAVRTFRLSRITGTVTVTGRSREHPPPADFDIATHDYGPAADEAPVRARVRVVPGRAASLRRLAVAEDGVDPWTAEVITVEAGSPDELVALACGAGSDATVLEPADVVASIAEALAAIATAHERASA